ncbi:DUF2493 domain-containing protein [Trichloromonas sp.]|uniref:DUF2493 domain-containing protein n=1 Tax=Trichloromonas sp. TaxID=3069249 RepID=UPI002A3CF9B1|nr:DUF2493 domain-containing protein [Trichloromonas sp.]
MRLSVVGSRTFNNYQLLKTKLDEIHQETPITLVVSGGAKGADSFAERWARENNIETKIYYPDWKLYGKKAGFVRNRDIVTNSDKMVAFWDNMSKGTLHSINIADYNQIPYMIVKF